MAKPNPRYQLYDIVEDRPPDRGRGNPMNNIGRREVCGLVPDTNLPYRHQVHWLDCSIYKCVWPLEMLHPLVNSEGVDGVALPPVACDARELDTLEREVCETLVLLDTAFSTWSADEPEPTGVADAGDHTLLSRHTFNNQTSLDEFLTHPQFIFHTHG